MSADKIANNKFSPKIIKNFKKKLELKRDKSKSYYDMQARERTNFSEGDSVLIWVSNNWEPAQIIKKYKTPRSYLVKTARGTILRQNSFHLRHRKNSFQNHMYDDFVTETANADSRETRDVVDAELNNGQRHIRRTGNAPQNNVYITRSGRPVKPPSRFRDFVM